MATILKEFFRDLPEPLLPREVYHPLLAVQSEYSIMGVVGNKPEIARNSWNLPELAGNTNNSRREILCSRIQAQGVAGSTGSRDIPEVHVAGSIRT